jgi:predicted nucleic acid-binding protein
LRLYLDVYALNRAFDDQSIDRNRLESEAVLAILARVSRKVHRLVRSEVIDRELAACPDREKAESVESVLRSATVVLPLSQSMKLRGHALLAKGFRLLDALRIASAEAARCEYLITTDDRLLRRAKAQAQAVRVGVVNPLVFVTEVDP